MPLGLLLGFRSVLQALVEHLLFGFNCDPGWGTTKQHGCLGRGTTPPSPADERFSTAH